MNVATPPPQRSGRYDAGVMKYKDLSLIHI